jgi:(5-formylfuran-3-yl)methyl phosphate synthase
MTALLVSVRSAEEATAACAGGAGLIDVKEPANGPLGRAEPAAVRAVLREVGGRRPVSAALGELQDDNRVPAVTGLAYAKWGLAGCGDDARWPDRLRAAGRWLVTVTPGCQLVAVAYGDWRRAHSPSPEAVCDFACSERCGALLLDTLGKDGTTLLDWTDLGDLRRLGRACRDARVPLALAGSLGPAELLRLLEIRPAWFAVRGAVCRGGNRQGAVDATAVAGLVRLLTDATAS